MDLLRGLAGIPTGMTVSILGCLRLTHVLLMTPVVGVRRAFPRSAAPTRMEAVAVSVVERVQSFVSRVLILPAVSY